MLEKIGIMDDFEKGVTERANQMSLGKGKGNAKDTKE